MLTSRFRDPGLSFAQTIKSQAEPCLAGATTTLRDFVSLVCHVTLRGTF